MPRKTRRHMAGYVQQITDKALARQLRCLTAEMQREQRGRQRRRG